MVVGERNMQVEMLAQLVHAVIEYALAEEHIATLVEAVAEHAAGAPAGEAPGAAPTYGRKKNGDH